MTVSRIECWVFRVPIESPVRTSFGTMTSRPALFLRVSAADGAWGWGEVFCNFPQVGAEHRARLVDSVFASLLEGSPTDDAPRVRERLEKQVRRLAIQCGEPGPFAQVIGAIDQALWDMAGRRAGQPLWKLLATGPAGGNRVRVYASGLGPGEVARTAMAKRDEGYRAFKFKVGFGAEKDRSNFSEIRAALGEDAVVMVDANQAWSPDEAMHRIAELAPFRPCWVEEPIAADELIPHWVDLSGRCGVPLAAGENLRGLDEFADALAAEFLAFIQPDVGKWGGLSGCRDVASLARRHGAIYCPHWLGGGIGLAASLHLRAAMGPEGFAEVDANPNLLREEVFQPTPRDGWVTLSDAPGLGVEPDLARLERFRVGR
ncbi:MAG: mandelate racemase/muconate lactonizing enzyme family protein [Betaproteobacteria bacterium]|nr:mandelate racemase/muconate lactonizing enzyme family protein [Betaproteobacteria bacterium]